MTRHSVKPSNTWLHIVTKKVAENQITEQLDGHRRINIHKTNNCGTKCSIDECKHEAGAKFPIITRYGRCGSKACQEAEIDCQMQYKIEYCQKTQLARYFWKGSHAVSDIDYQTKTTSTPRKFKLSREELNILESLVKTGLSPKIIFSHINHDDHFQTKPTFRWVQNYVNHHRYEGKTDEMVEIEDFLKSTYLGFNNRKHAPVIVGVDMIDGYPVIGVGSDLDPFVVGFTTLGLMEKIKTFHAQNLNSMMHIDATYKITTEILSNFGFGHFRYREIISTFRNFCL